MRSRTFLLFFLLISTALILPAAAHAAIPFWGPIIPPESASGIADSDLCPGNWAMLITVVNNVIQLLLTLGIVLLVPIRIAFAGFNIVTHPDAPAVRTKEGKAILDTVIGLVVAVSAWLIVDAVMVTLYHPDVPGWDAWSSLIKGEGKLCLKQAGSLPTDKLNEADITGITATGQTLDFSVNNVSGNACNPQTIVDAVPGVSIKTANLLACIAKGESDCGKTNKDNYNENEFWNKDLGGKYAGKASTAAGAYQVLLQSNSDCYNIPVCEEAVGTPGVALNCKKGFNPNGSGFTAGGDATILNKCVKAAGDVHCSAAAAVCVLSHQSFSSAYATDRYLPICQGKYGN